MSEIINQNTLAEFEAFIAAHPKGHFLQSSRWAKVKSAWDFQAVAVRGDDGAIKGAMSVLIRKMPGVPYKLMYAARGPVCDLEDAEALKDLTDGAAHLAKKNKAYVVYMNGTVAKAKGCSKKVIEPGCEIIVRTKIQDPTILPTIMSIVSATASMLSTIYALINSATK